MLTSTDRLAGIQCERQRVFPSKSLKVTTMSLFGFEHLMRLSKGIAGVCRFIASRLLLFLSMDFWCRYSSRTLRWHTTLFPSSTYTCWVALR